MARGFRFWRLGAGLYFLVNFGGAILAAMQREEMHMMLHIFLLALGVVGYGGWWLGTRGRRQNVPAAQLPTERLEYLQQSVDAIALEVERVGEAQRFADKLRAEGGEPPPLKKE
jgi:high-affinity Fe2+/Pb2+ permease